MSFFKHEDKIYKNNTLVVFLDDAEKHLKVIFNDYINADISALTSKILPEVLDIKEYIINNYGYYAMIEFLNHAKLIVKNFECGWSPSLLTKKTLLSSSINEETTQITELLKEYIEYDIEKSDSLEKINLLVKVIKKIDQNEELMDKLISTLIQNYMSEKNYFLQEKDIKNILEDLDLNATTKSIFVKILESSVKAKTSDIDSLSTSKYSSIYQNSNNSFNSHKDDADLESCCSYSDDDLVTCVDFTEPYKTTSNKVEVIELDELCIASLFELPENKSEKRSNIFINFIKSICNMILNLEVVAFILDKFQNKKSTTDAFSDSKKLK